MDIAFYETISFFSSRQSHLHGDNRHVREDEMSLP